MCSVSPSIPLRSALFRTVLLAAIVYMHAARTRIQGVLSLVVSMWFFFIFRLCGTNLGSESFSDYKITLKRPIKLKRINRFEISGNQDFMLTHNYILPYEVALI